jgi:hypothetical protein
MVNANKVEESGEGLLSRAGRYAPEPGGAEAGESPEGKTKTPRTGDVEKETERAFAALPSKPEESGRRERKGLLRRALTVSEEQPKSKRQSRRERRRAEKEASEAYSAGASADEIVPETPAVEGVSHAAAEEPALGSALHAAAEETIPEVTFEKEASMEIPVEETSPVEATALEGLSFDETTLAGSAVPSGPPDMGYAVPELPDTGLPAPGLPDTGLSVEMTETLEPQTAVQEEEAPVAGDFSAGLSAGLPGEAQEEPAVDLTSEFPAELDFGDEAVSASEAAVKRPASKRIKGLLAMASLFAEKERTGKGKARRARPAAKQAVATKTGGARKALGTPIEKGPAAEAKLPSKAEKGRFARSEGPAAPYEEGVSEEEVFALEGEAAIPETVEMRGDERAVEVKEFARSLESYLSRRDALSALELFNASVAREGHTSFILRILETMTNLGKGKSGLLFTPSGDRYAVELRVPPHEQRTKVKNMSFKQDSRFIQALKESGRGFFRNGGRKGESLKKETSRLGSLSPWVAVPFLVGNELVAFVVIGKRPDRPKTDEGAVALLARLSAPYIDKYLLLKEHRSALSSLEKELRERDSLYSLYSAFENPGEKLELPERCVRALIEGISASLGIGSAAVLADWKPKTASGGRAQGIGSYVPVASVGVPEKALSRFKVSTKDREIRAIVEAGRPSVPKDASKRMETLSKFASPETGGRSGESGAASKWPRSYAAVPLLFNGDSLGLLVVFEMKGAGKTLTQEAAERLRRAARVLVPALLYGRLHGTSPFDMMRGLISSKLEEAKRSDTPLAVAVFIVENAKRACGEMGFSKYWVVVERLRKLIETSAGEEGIVKDVDWNRLTLFFREHGKNEVDDVVARVRTSFSGGLRKNERESGISLATLMTRYPKESKSVEEILVSVM